MDTTDASSGHIHFRWESTDPAFIHGCALLEQVMTEKGLDPSAFSIEKHSAAFHPFAGIGVPNSTSYDYTVTIHDKSFTVTKYNDLIFLEYLAGLCMAPDDNEDNNQGPPHESLLRKEVHKLIGWLQADSFPKEP